MEVFENKIYALPFYATSSVTIYNKKIYSKCIGDNFIKTYEELNKISKKYKECANIASFASSINENDTLAKILNKHSISANAITIFGFIIGMMAINFLAMNMYFEALICILINRFCDVLDGAVARIEGISKFGIFR